MPRRKKKLLFDVLDDLSGPTPVARPLSETRPKKPAKPAQKAPPKPKPVPRAPGEIRVTTNMAWTLGFVFLGFLLCSYYFGLVHGRNEDSDGTSSRVRTSLQRSTPASRDAWQTHYAISAVVRGYQEYTYDAIREDFRAYRDLLLDEGIEFIDAYDYPSAEGDGSGRLVLWIGRGESAEVLEPLAERLRALRDASGMPFETAFVTQFKDEL